jgi:hypothetical protein
MIVNEAQNNPELLINNIVNQDNLVEFDEVAKKTFEDFIVKKQLRVKFDITETDLFVTKKAIYYHKYTYAPLTNAKYPKKSISDNFLQYQIDLLKNEKFNNFSPDVLLYYCILNKISIDLITKEIIDEFIQYFLELKSELELEIVPDEFKQEIKQKIHDYKTCIRNLRKLPLLLENSTREQIDWKKTAENMYNYYNPN